MPQNEDMYLSLDGSVPKRSGIARVFMVGASLIGGASLGLLATSSLSPKLTSTSAVASSDLLAMPTFSQRSIVSGFGGPTLASLPGSSKWKELAIATIEANSRCDVGGLKPTPRFTAALANMRSKDVEPVVRAAKSSGSPFPYLGKGDDEPGVFKPLGYWDPLGLATDATDGQIAYFREAELKHGRICMLSTLGIYIGEKYHPLFGGDIDTNAVQAVTKVNPTVFWPLILLVLGGIELKTSSGRATEFANSDDGRASDRTDIARNGKELLPGLEPGDLGFDPLGLKNLFTEEEYVGIQDRELAHCRLAMIAAFGILSQELAFPDVKIYPLER